MAVALASQAFWLDAVKRRCSELLAAAAKKLTEMLRALAVAAAQVEQRDSAVLALTAAGLETVLQQPPPGQPELAASGAEQPLGEGQFDGADIRCLKRKREPSQDVTVQ